MKSSNLAERLEQFDTLEKLRLSRPPETRLVMTPGGGAEAARKPGRMARRTPGIVIRDDGLRLFQVR